MQAIARTGEVVGCDFGGSRQGPYLWGPKRVIWVAGANKIVADRAAALRRVYEVAFPLEDARIRQAGDVGSSVNKVVIYEREPLADARIGPPLELACWILTHSPLTEKPA